MNLQYIPRPFYPDELRILRTRKAQTKKEKVTQIRFYHYIIAALIGALFFYLLSVVQIGFLDFLFGWIAALTVGFIVFTPFKDRKAQKRRSAYIASLDHFMSANTVSTCRIKAKRTAVAQEFDDESDLYIIECDTGQVLFMWDFEYNLRKKLPCLEFEIYERDFFRLLGRQVYPLTERIKPLIIDRKTKWNYLGKFGHPNNLEIAKDDFDKIMADFDACREG